jgi:hypothetical protein
MAKKPRNYGWSPEQMARINARREARGADLYIDKKMGGLDYMNRYESESGKYGAESVQAKQARPSERPSGLDKYRGQKSVREKMEESKAGFSERFAPKGTLADTMKTQSEIGKIKRKPGMGISTPTLQSSFSRFIA